MTYLIFSDFWKGRRAYRSKATKMELSARIITGMMTPFHLRISENTKKGEECIDPNAVLE